MLKNMLVGVVSFWAMGSYAYAQSGCELAPPPQTNGARDVAVSSGAGAAFGALLGGAIGNNSGSGDASDGAKAGALFGALAGAAVGLQAAADRREYQTQSEYLDCEIAYTEAQIADRRLRIEDAKAQTEKASVQVAELKRLHDANVATESDLRAMRIALANQLETVNTEIGVVGTDIQRLRDIEANAVARANEDENMLVQRKNELSERIMDLELQYADLIGARRDILMASETLDSIG